MKLLNSSSYGALAVTAILCAFLFQSCGSSPSPIEWKVEPLVDSEKRIDDSMYSIYGDSIEAFALSINTALEQPHFKNYIIRIPDSIESAWMYAIEIFTDSLPPDSLGLTYRNCLLVFNEQNLFSFKKPKNERAFGVDEQFSLMQFTSLLRHEGKPASTHEINADTWKRDSLSNDSISKSSREDLIARKLKAIDLKKKVKYLLVVEDKCLKRPKMLTKTTFDSGLLVSDTKLIRLNDSKIVGQKTFLIENGAELDYIQQMSMLSGPNSILENDLTQRRNTELVDFYNIH